MTVAARRKSPQLSDHLAKLTARAKVIKETIPVSEIVGRDVKLIGRGKEKLGLCPFHAEKTPSFTVRDDKEFFHCFGCGSHGDVIGYVMRTRGLGYGDAIAELEGGAGVTPRPSPASAGGALNGAARAAEEAQERNAKLRAAGEIWAQSAPIEPNSVVWRYLNARGLAFDRYPEALRAHPSLRHPYQDRRDTSGFPALVARAVDLRGEFAGVHRVYLDRDTARKIDVVKAQDGKIITWPQKCWLPSLQGAAVRLFPADAIGHIGIAIGLENALAAHLLFGVPVWSVLVDSNLRHVQLPFMEIGRVTIYAENDPPQLGEGGKMWAPEGVCMKSARILQQRLTAPGEGRQVDILKPKPGFKDFNDVLLAQRKGGS
jgi:DNA primase